ncbi:L-2,4-diaminobutyrate transaminase [Paraburkholderia caballeronis]|uniref:aminotransferase n=1 Tax=Paraburkholderia caballeronis TaxID=416943 RepID=UPI0010651DC8|nr:aminotransferase [Paraburkholderia caballeronis]TDV33602.1 L-2,4-diaminobutyrate transaminase [Paraburkholderia caballeronis]
MDFAAAGLAPDLNDLDRRFFFHPFTALGDHERNGPLVIVKGEGVWLEDSRGARYIDSMAGLWCVNAGYGRREIADAIHAQALRLPYYHAFASMSTDAPIVLSQKLIEMAPVPMSKVFFGNSGSDANDTQIKLVWYYNHARGLPEKRKIIARERGYHGVTVATAGLTGLPGLHKGFGLPLPFIRHTTAPHRLWQAEPGQSDEAFVAKLAGDLERLIVAEGPDTVGAMIMEPVMGAGGVIVPPPGYYAAIQKVLDKYDVLLIADEVICGFGRLGAMFGSEVMGMKPDLITVAKGVTSAYVPLSASLVSEKVWRTIVEGSNTLGVFGHGFTYSGHPIAAAAALANLKLIEDERLVGQAAARGALMHRLLRDTFADHPAVGEVRGMGLVGAVEFVARREPAQRFDPALKVAGRIAKAALAQGLITRALPEGDSIAFSPPFVISEDEVAEMVRRARVAADQVFAELKAEGHWNG